MYAKIFYISKSLWKDKGIFKQNQTIKRLNNDIVKAN